MASEQASNCVDFAPAVVAASADDDEVSMHAMCAGQCGHGAGCIEAGCIDGAIDGE